MRSGAGFGFGAGKGTDAGDVAAGEQGKCTICLNAPFGRGKGETSSYQSVSVLYSRNTSWAIYGGLIVIAFSHRSLHTPTKNFVYFFAD